MGLTTGDHADYHRTSDEAAKIDRAGLAVISELTLNLVQRLGGDGGARSVARDPAARSL